MSKQNEATQKQSLNQVELELVQGGCQKHAKGGGGGGGAAWGGK